MGRHVVLHKIGAGGMGVVYAAYDPQLDRKLALKVLLPGSGGETSRLRLLREAQALARLSHPNVVTIHDVGTIGEQVWLAMEFLQGQTLGRWLETPRAWSEVVAIMLEAGGGLAAAHGVDLLHRDFKPDNVMVGDDGRVAVMDFGLAREPAGSRSHERSKSSADGDSRSVLASDVTRSGALVGTPRYMAPEQFDRKELTATADQFSFCVTLWKALYNEHPFGGDTLTELFTNTLEGRLRAPSSTHGVPGWLRLVCERGLAVDPEARWPSMSALLEALTKGQARARWRTGLVAVGVLAVLGGGLEGYRRWDVAQRTAACEAAGNEVRNAWSDERAVALRDALMATGVTTASTTVEKVGPWLDRQAQAWREARVEACLDTKVRERWDADTLDRSLWCLEERRTELQSLVDELTAVDVDVLNKAVPATAGLTSVAPCRDEAKLDRVTPPPVETREALRLVRADIVRASNLQRAGLYDEGLALVRVALARAEELRWPSLVARARAQLGSLLNQSGAYADAEAELEKAYFEAMKGGSPEVALRAATELVVVVGAITTRPAEGRRWAQHADVALDDVFDGDQLFRALLQRSRALLSHAAGDYDEAQALFEQALAIQQESLGHHHLDVAQTLNNLSRVHYASGRYEEVRAAQERALVIKRDALGPEHPGVARSLDNLAYAYIGSGDYPRAKELFEQAYAIRRKALSPEHPDLANSLSNLANIYHTAGDNPRARELHEQALAIKEKAVGAKHPDVARSLINLANIHHALGEHAQAKDRYERALAIQEELLDPGHPDIANSLNNLAVVSHTLGDLVAAKELYARALAIWEQALGPEHPQVASALVGLASITVEQGRPDEAIALARRATQLREKAGVGAELVAEARYVHAHALWDAPPDAGRDRAQAIALTEQVRDALRDAGEGERSRLAEVEAWLAEHPLP